MCVFTVIYNTDTRIHSNLFVLYIYIYMYIWYVYIVIIDSRFWFGIKGTDHMCYGSPNLDSIANGFIIRGISSSSNFFYSEFYMFLLSIY